MGPTLWWHAQHASSRAACRRALLSPRHLFLRAVHEFARNTKDHKGTQGKPRETKAHKGSQRNTRKTKGKTKEKQRKPRKTKAHKRHRRKTQGTQRNTEENKEHKE